MEDECVQELGRPISSLKVTELKDELTKRSLTKSGTKNELIGRLRAAIQREAGQKHQTDPLNLHASAQLARVEPQSLQQQQFQHQQQIDYQYEQNAGINLAQLPVQNESYDLRHYNQATCDEVNNYEQAQIQQPFGLQSNIEQSNGEQAVLNLCVPDTKEQPLELPQETESQAAEEKNEEDHEQEEEQEQDQEQDQEQGGEQEQEEEQEQEGEQEQGERLQNYPQPEANDDVHQERVNAEPQKVQDIPQKHVEKEQNAEGENPSQTNIEKAADSTRRDKKRRWSSKTSIADVHSSIDSSQLSIISHGLSSQKLLELIPEKVIETKLAVQEDRSAELIPREDSTPPDYEENKQDIDAPKTQIATEDVSAKEVSKQDAEPTAPPASPSEDKEPSNVLYIQNLVRPFTIAQLKEVLTKHGEISEDKFWTDKVKSKCIVVYESIEVAKFTKEELHGQRWPQSNPKTLKVVFSDEDTLQNLKNSEVAKPLPAAVPAKDEGNASKKSAKAITERLGEKIEGESSANRDSLKNRLGGRFTEADTDDKNEQPQSTSLDDLFRKTKATPSICWLPLNEDQAEKRGKVRQEREKNRRENVVSKERRRSPIRKRFRSRSPSPLRKGPRRRPISRSRSGSRPHMRSRSRSPNYLSRRGPSPKRPVDVSPQHRRLISPRGRFNSPPLQRSRFSPPPRNRQHSPPSRERHPSPLLKRQRSPPNRPVSPLLRRQKMSPRPRPMSPLLRKRTPSPRIRDQSPLLRRRRSDSEDSLERIRNKRRDSQTRYYPSHL